MTMTMMMMLFFAFYLYVFLLWYICCNIYAIEIERLDLVSVYGVIKYRDNKKGITVMVEQNRWMGWDWLLKTKTLYRSLSQCNLHITKGQGISELCSL